MLGGGLTALGMLGGVFANIPDADAGGHEQDRHPDPTGLGSQILENGAGWTIWGCLVDSVRGSDLYGRRHVRDRGGDVPQAVCLNCGDFARSPQEKMRILDLALKDLSQIFRDKRSLLFLIVMPIGFTFFMGFAYRTADKSTDADNRIVLVVVNPQSEAVLNRMLIGRLGLSNDIRIESMGEADAMDALYKGNAAGVLAIPVGFSEQASAGKVAQLKLITKSTSAQGQSLYQLLRVPISQLMSAVEISRETADIVEAQDSSAEQNAAFELAWGKWDVNSQLPLVKVEQAIATDWTGGNPYNRPRRESWCSLPSLA